MEPTRKDYEFFKSHLQEICEGHIGEYVAIKDESVIGYYISFDEAMDTAAKQFEMGTFIVQQCVKDISDNSVIFHSRVSV